MEKKKIFSRNEFETLRELWAKEMAEDTPLAYEAREVFIKADRYNWVHQTTWFGEPALQLPQDLFAIQDIIFRTRPKFIIELGVAWAGSLLFYSTIMEILGGDKAIGVDIFIPDDLKGRINSFSTLSEKIELIEGSSLDPEIHNQISSIIGNSTEVMVILDSYHTHEHVLRELEYYSKYVGLGHYLVVSDTIIENIPIQKHRPRDWGPGNNPMTAVEDFLQKNNCFEVDIRIDNKLLFSCNPKGFLKKINENCQ